MRKKTFRAFSIILTGFCLILILFSDASAIIPWTGVVLDKETGEPIEGVVIVRSWNKVKGVPGLGSTITLIALKEALSDEKGKFVIFGKMPSFTIPFFTWVEEDSPIVFKPGYEFLVLNGNQRAIALTRIHTIPELRQEELREARGHRNLSHIYWLDKTIICRDMIKQEEDFIDTSLYLIDAQPLMDSLKKEKNHFVKEHVVGQLADTLDPRAFDTLIDIARNDKWKLRSTAIEALCKKEDPRTVELLMMNPEESCVKKTLVKIGAPSVEPLCESLKGSYSGSSIMAAWVLGEIKDPRAVEPLKNWLQDQSEGRRLTAAEALGKINEKNAAEALVVVALRDNEQSVRQTAAEALEKIGYPGLKVVFAQSQADVSDLSAPANLILDEQSGSGADQMMEHEINAVKNEDFIPPLPVPKGSSLLWVHFDPGNYLKSIVYMAAEPQDEEQGTRKIAHLTFGKAKKFQSVQSLENEDPNSRDMTVRTLAESQDFRSTPILVDALSDENKKVRLSAGVALGRIKHPLAVKYLVSAIKDEDVLIRRNAIKTLGEINNTIALVPILRTTESVTVGMKTRMVLVRYRDPWIEDQLIANMRYDTFEDCRLAIDVLGKIKRREASDLLITVAKAGTATQWPAFAALVQIGEPSVAPLIAALQDDNSDIRVSAAWALGGIKDARAVEPLIYLLKDKDENVRWHAAKALGEIKDPRAVEPLIDASMKDEKSKVRKQALNALAEMGPLSVERLLQGLKDASSYVRWRSAWALGKMRTTEAVEPLIQALHDKEPEVKWMAAVALGEIGDHRAIAPLNGLVDDQDAGVRSCAEFSLTRIKSKIKEAF